MEIKKQKILITGGAGFIGSHLVRLLLKEYPEASIFNLDALTYAGNLENLSDVENEDNYYFIHANITHAGKIQELFNKYKFDIIVHLAAESHVDRSIIDPYAFVNTNITGTINLLTAAKTSWSSNLEGKLFYHISTDEVYGSLGETGFFKETSRYSPNSPYSASKASSDHFVRAFGETYNLPFLISNCSNNYGPNQFPEKLIPLFISNCIDKKELPVYGDGKYTRDWLYVKDHAQAIHAILKKGIHGETYNIGGNNEWQNIELIKTLCKLMDKKLHRHKGETEKLITFISDRPGHDRRYAIDAAKLKNEIGWEPSVNFEEGLAKTIDWYLENTDWLTHVKTGKYREYNLASKLP